MKVSSGVIRSADRIPAFDGWGFTPNPSGAPPRPRKGRRPLTRCSDDLSVFVNNRKP